ncbi:MAG: PD40 domain-containing protein [Gemmatimonadota bacterium]|nr:MAG: PD40 domain-containing protein [Gemmatimonadota bacterium]
MSVSPDGRLVTGFFGTAGNLAVRDLNTGETRNLTNKGYPELVMGSVFSPDGGRIAYSWHNADDFDDLRVVGLDDSEPRLLYRDPRRRSVAIKNWSLDGKQLLITIRGAELDNEIASVAVSDGSIRRLVPDMVLHELPARMAFSPEGDLVVYDVRVPEGLPNHDIYIVERDAVRARALVEHAADDVLLGWSPDGTGILFASDRSGEVDIWFLPLDNGYPDGHPRVLKGNVGQLAPLALSQDGSFYYGVTRCDCGVYLAELDPVTGSLDGAPRRVASAFHRTGVDWSPDGKRLAYVTPAGGVLADNWMLAVQSLETGDSRTFGVSVWVLHQLRPFWSPDGRFLLAKGWDSSAYPREVVYGVAVETGELKTLVASPSYWHDDTIEWVEWSADGKAVFFVRGTAGFPPSLRIVRRDLESGQEEDLFEFTAPPYVYGLTASPDGRHLAFGVWDTGERRSILNILPLEAGEPLELTSVSLPAGIDPPAWTPDSRHLIYQTDGELWRISIDGGEPLSLGSLAPLAIYRGALSVHPAGRRIAFVAEPSRSSEVWVLKNLPSVRSEPEGSVR